MLSESKHPSTRKEPVPDTDAWVLNRQSAFGNPPANPAPIFFALI